MNIIRFTVFLVLVSKGVVAWTTNDGNKPVKPLTEAEKCEKLVDMHANCLEQALQSQASQSDFESKVDKCVTDSLGYLQENIQSENLESRLKEVLTAGGLGHSVPEECAKEKDSDHQFICAIRLEKQRTCSK